jgi:hypothetical protein
VVEKYFSYSKAEPRVNLKASQLLQPGAHGPGLRLAAIHASKLGLQPFQLGLVLETRGYLNRFLNFSSRALAEQLVDPDRPGCFNQALMELGALLCTPTSPKCPGCPITEQCEALRLVKLGAIGSVTAFPEKKVKKAPREETVAVCVVELHKGGGIYIQNQYVF